MESTDDDKPKKALNADNITYSYSKFRYNFGKRCTFSDYDTEALIDIHPDEGVRKRFKKMERIDVGVDACPPMSCKEINTSHIKYTTTGVNHVEGGWPKDINYLDQEQTIRYRKKAEREESYIPTMQKLCKLADECIQQNNSLDIYVKYFSKEPAIDYHPEVSAVVSTTLRDPSGQKRAVSCVAWHPFDNTERLGIAQCDLDFKEVLKPCYDSYIWRIENPFQPDIVLTGTSPLLSMEYNYKDVNLVAGGQHNGQVAFFDLRKSGKPVGLTDKPVSHLEPVYSLIWIQSKTGFECFTTSSDGQVLWWDMRNLSESTDQMCIDPTKANDINISEGGMALEYSTNVPTKFMVGTERGNIYSCTRRAKQPGDKIGQVYSEHFGPVYLLQRNFFLYKVFLTVGDYHANIWAEDFPHSPIWKTPMYNSHVLHGGWSPPRPSVFFLTKADGTFDVWDLMYKQKGPEYSLKLCDNRLHYMSVQEKGEFVAVGSETGKTYVLQMSSEVFEYQGKEKNFFMSMVERESRREKFLFDKEKDKKMAKTHQTINFSSLVEKDMSEVTEQLQETTEMFYQTIEEELKKLKVFKRAFEPAARPWGDTNETKIQINQEQLGPDGLAKQRVKVVSMPDDQSLPLYRNEGLASMDAADVPDGQEDYCLEMGSSLVTTGNTLGYTQGDCPATIPPKSAVDFDIEESIAACENKRPTLTSFKMRNKPSWIGEKRLDHKSLTSAVSLLEKKLLSEKTNFSPDGSIAVPKDETAAAVSKDAFVDQALDAGMKEMSIADLEVLAENYGMGALGLAKLDGEDSELNRIAGETKITRVLEDMYALDTMKEMRSAVKVPDSQIDDVGTKTPKSLLVSRTTLKGESQYKLEKKLSERPPFSGEKLVDRFVVREVLKDSASGKKKSREIRGKDDDDGERSEGKVKITDREKEKESKEREKERKERDKLIKEKESREKGNVKEKDKKIETALERGKGTGKVKEIARNESIKTKSSATLKKAETAIQPEEKTKQFALSTTEIPPAQKEEKEKEEVEETFFEDEDEEEMLADEDENHEETFDMVAISQIEQNLMEEILDIKTTLGILPSREENAGKQDTTGYLEFKTDADLVGSVDNVKQPDNVGKMSPARPLVRAPSMNMEEEARKVFNTSLSSAKRISTLKDEKS